MIERLAERLVVWQVKKNYIHEKEINLYAFAYKLFIGQAVNVLIACLLATLFHAGLMVFAFLATFFPLRSYVGGHHADSYSTCTVASSLIVCMACIASKVIHPGEVLIVNVTAGIICGGCILKLAPMGDKNKPLNDKEIVQYRKNSILIWSVESFLWVLFYYVGASNLSLAIGLGQLSVAVLLGMGIIKKQLKTR